MMAWTLLSILHARRAVRLNPLSLQKMFLSGAKTCIFQHRHGGSSSAELLGYDGLGITFVEISYNGVAVGKL